MLDSIVHHYLDTRSSLSLPRCRLLCWAWWKWYLATLKQWSGQQQQPKPKPRWSVTKLGSLHSAVNAVREGSFHYIMKRVKDHLGRVLHTDNLLYQSIAPSSTWYPWGPSRVNITILNWLHNNSFFFHLKHLMYWWNECSSSKYSSAIAMKTSSSISKRKMSLFVENPRPLLSLVWCSFLKGPLGWSRLNI